MTKAKDTNDLFRLIVESGMPTKELARMFNISYRILNSWKYGEVAPDPKKEAIIKSYLKELIKLNKKYI